MSAHKVLLVNGSPNKQGCVYTVLTEIQDTLKKNGVESNILWIGNNPIAGCIGCGKCIGNRKCFRGDIVNDMAEKIPQYEGFVFGTPVHYAGASGGMTSFMDRVFFIDEFNGNLFAGKPAASVATCRRSGGTATLDQLNKYMTDCNMPIVPSRYWNVVHGNKPEEIRQDLEGLQVMQTLAMNMAWLIKCIDAGRKAGIEIPKYETPVMTNFI
ncbi:MAG: flavodoxin family protein [Bacteroidales bacterium]|jgi:multimeric flavodoxin WrbA|nr:flavodoxin family protein [Bacteroidales bacterium]